MTTQTFRFYLPRLAFSVLLLGLLGISGAGQAQTPPLRIGLQTKQQEVRLQANVPIRLNAQGLDEPVEVPAAQPIIFRVNRDTSMTVEPGQADKLAFTGPVSVTPVLPAEGAPAQPAIRLLGPTRHYDGKPDRPYHGSFEILPRAEGLTVVNVVDVEPYLYGVVSSEMSPDYAPEALKAQAVAARTYAIKNVGRFAALGYDLDDTANSQVYGGLFSEDPRTTAAVDGSAGQVLFHGGKIIDAVYSSTCGGYTESALEAWGRDVPYLQSVPDFQGDIDPTVAVRPTDDAGWAAYFKTARALNCLQPKYAKPEAFRWVKLVTRKELEAGLPADQQVGTVKDIVPLHRGASGRITSLRVDGSDRSVTVNTELTIRRALGKLRSSAFTVDIYRDDNGVPVVFAFWGAGWGHGLGMCQVGAQGLALQGWAYDKILAYYYKGAELKAP